MVDWSDPGLWAAAAFAPVAVWVLWRLQTLSVELLRRALGGLLRGQKVLYNVVSWFGVLIHELSHASVLLLSGHGIKGFRVGVDSGHVTPGKSRGGALPFLSFLLAAFAPLFIPPILVLLGAIFLLKTGPVPHAEAAAGLEPAWDALRSVLVEFPRDLALSIGRLDLTRPAHIGFLLLLLLSSPSSRPSFAKGSRWHGERDEGDVAVVRRRIRANPVPFILFILLLYGLYFALVAPGVDATANAYWLGFAWIWAVAMTGVVVSLVATVWWAVTAQNGRVSRLFSWLPPAAAIATALLLPKFVGWDLLAVNGIALGAWLALSLVFSSVLPRGTRRI